MDKGLRKGRTTVRNTKETMKPNDIDSHIPIITKRVGGSIERVRLHPHPEIKRKMNTKLGTVKDIFLGGDRIWVQLEDNTTMKLDLTTINKLV